MFGRTVVTGFDAPGPKTEARKLEMEAEETLPPSIPELPAGHLMSSGRWKELEKKPSLAIRSWLVTVIPSGFCRDR